MVIDHFDRKPRQLRRLCLLYFDSVWTLSTPINFLSFNVLSEYLIAEVKKLTTCRSLIDKDEQVLWQLCLIEKVIILKLRWQVQDDSTCVVKEETVWLLLYRPWFRRLLCPPKVVDRTSVSVSQA